MTNNAERDAFADWLWIELMDWCKRMGTSPASHNELFKIVSKARAQASGVPDALPEVQVCQTYLGEPVSPEMAAYHEGWNYCRAEMLRAAQPGPTPPKSASVPVERLEAFISQHGADATHACDEYEVLASLKELIAEYRG